MGINLIYEPFQSDELNTLETVSIVTSMLTIFCGLFFILDVNQTNIESDSSTANSTGKLNHLTSTAVILEPFENSNIFEITKSFS